jgi:hypothetical protein
MLSKFFRFPEFGNLIHKQLVGLLGMEEDGPFSSPIYTLHNTNIDESYTQIPAHEANFQAVDDNTSLGLQGHSDRPFVIYICAY